MESELPVRSSRDGHDVPDTEMPDVASPSPAGRSPSPSPKRQHPIGWSLQDEEYESDPEDDSVKDTEDQDGTGSDDVVQEDDDDALGQLRYWLESNYKDSLFACGGAVPIVSEAESPSSKETPSSPASQASSTTAPSTAPHPPVTLRWDPRDSSTPAGHCRLTVPIDEATSDHLDRLLADMQPATFGLGGEDMYDENYRKASKLDPSKFATNFCPYNVGIIDVVSQLLLPNPASGKQRAIKAELYKLNVYTGPSGHFRAHVDTPRSRSQFGSLVVCFPVKHEGGALEVRHEDQALTFDWASCANSDAPQIQWAAFYSDCEHEVFPVQSGHRITLTYNLYVTFGNGQLSGRPNALDTTQTPLYRHLEAVINDDTFLPDGGYLGFYTTHAYPQTASQPSQGCLTDILKGLDMAIWHAFQRLGCGVCLRPVLVSDPFEIKPRAFKVGKEFAFRNFHSQVEDYREWEWMLNRWGPEEISWSDLIWLNEANLKTKHASFAYTAYGNEASSEIAYSLCAIIIGVPKWHGGERMRLETTFIDKGGEEKDWEHETPYDLDN
ncbi:hypothetical protein QQX98_008535 [Neonectria punicea]|uniref:Fe2OG dioxygenase domain-containing protein n=1 Tax=Neonectria punicea TaxID=979145 RepID=A0ABR1GUX4_9HYPO